MILFIKKKIGHMHNINDKFRILPNNIKSGRLFKNKENIQCIVGDYSFCNTQFGKTQKPELEDYADGEDVMKFLMG